jgi:hypothetical protein
MNFSNQIARLLEVGWRPALLLSRARTVYPGGFRAASDLLADHAAEC